MALLSNINDKFAVDSTGAIQFNGQVGTSGYVLKSNANAAPTWVDPSTVIGGPYLPLSGGTLTGALAGTSATFSGTISAVGASTFNLGEGIFTKAVNTSSAIASSNVWGYGLYEGASRIGEFSMVRDGSSSVYIGTSFAGQKLILGTAAKVPALTLDASQNATFAGTVQVNGSNVTVIKNSDPALTVSDTDTNYRGSMRWLSSSNVLEFFTRYAGTYYTNNLVLDRGNVGIGTNSLGEKLVIRETSNTAATRIKIEGGSYGFTLGKTTQAANYVHLRPGSNSPAVFRIMPNVGPNYSYMEVWGTDFESNTTNYNRLMFYINGSTGDANIKINKAGSSPAGSLYIGTASSEQAITILNSGNVGIGTTTPAAKLDVAGDITIQNGLYTYKTQGYTAGSSAINVDITVGNEGGGGNVFKIEAGFAHYYGMSYNSIGEWWCTSRGTTVINTYILNAGTTFGGTWSSSKPNNTTLRVTKSAGTYAGGGKWWIKVTYVPF